MTSLPKFFARQNCTIKRSIPQQVAGAIKLLTNQA
jgi:hypothetical protein